MLQIICFFASAKIDYRPKHQFMDEDGKVYLGWLNEIAIENDRFDVTHCLLPVKYFRGEMGTRL
jgi:hypothetical protein